MGAWGWVHFYIFFVDDHISWDYGDVSVATEGWGWVPGDGFLKMGFFPSLYLYNFVIFVLIR